MCSVTGYDTERNQGSTSLWLLSTAGAAPARVTRCGSKDGQAGWSPKGERIASVARREQAGMEDETPQLYLIAPDGGEATRVGHFAPGVSSFKWMPDGKRIVFAAWVWPGHETAAAQERQHKAWSGRKARIVSESPNEQVVTGGFDLPALDRSNCAGL